MISKLIVVLNRKAQVIPVEVKSARNVKARSLQKFMKEGASPYVIRLSENNFGIKPIEKSNAILRAMPLYAAYCIDPNMD